MLAFLVPLDMRTQTETTAMAAPAEHHKSLLLYHGTTDEESFAQDILKCGYLQGRIVQGRAQQAPVAGYVYTSKDVMYAAGYAGVYTSWGLGCTQKRREGHEQFTGYVFVVDASAASDILVDEDVLGEIGTSRSNKYSMPDNLYHYLQNTAIQCATLNQLNKARNYEMAYQSAIGKKMQKAIPEQKMRELIDHCPHLALKNPEQRMPIVGYYTINKCVSTPEEFFANATYHEYKQNQAVASSTEVIASILTAGNVPHLVVAADDSAALESLRNQVQGILRDLGYTDLPTPVLEIKHRYDSEYLAQCQYSPDDDINNTKIVFMRNSTENPELARRLLVHELCHHIDFMVYWAPLARQSKTQYNREMRLKDRLGDSSSHGAHGKFWQALAAKANTLYGEGYVQKYSDKAAREQQAEIPPYYILLKNDLITKKMTMARASKPSTVQKLYLSKLEQMDPDHEVYKLVKSTNPTLAGAAALIGKGFVAFRDADLTAMLLDMWNNAEPISIEAPEASKNAGYYVLVYREERRNGQIMFRWAQASRPSAAQKAYIARAVTSAHNPPKLYKVASANLARGVAIGKGQGFIPESTPQGAAVQKELAELWDSGTELGAG